ncbi:hypothetical protein V866_003732 [Kwoniella sp. B9012]|uniref:Zn(2)-C6 fungal-type domain-containing protein n=1 Tax=Kwoniella europaea PYCC6329 TaxID=1423913 RepID=A0AAX4KIK8_9TREE
MAETQSSGSMNTGSTGSRYNNTTCDPCRRSKIKCEPPQDQSGCCGTCYKNGKKDSCHFSNSWEFYGENPDLKRSTAQVGEASAATGTGAQGSTVTTGGSASNMPSTIPPNLTLGGFYSSVNEDRGSTIKK